MDTLLSHPKLDDQSSVLVKDILTTLILKAENHKYEQNLMVIKIIQKFYDIHNIHIFKSVLWLIGEFAPENHIEQALDAIIKAIGKLPIEEEKVVKIEEEYSFY